MASEPEESAQHGRAASLGEWQNVSDRSRVRQTLSDPHFGLEASDAENLVTKRSWVVGPFPVAHAARVR
ncbi:MAG: hypothetical protein ACKV2Q_06515, partial [Planctomycetaceae bacterium]